MFGKHKLSQETAEAKAVVTSVELYQGGMRANWGTGFTYDVGMRVHFDDDTTADVVRRIGGMGGTDLTFTVGDIVPVRYDPRDRDKIELDEDALRAEQQRARQLSQSQVDQANQQAVRDAEARLAGTTATRPTSAPDPDPDQLDALVKLDDLHRSGALTDAEFEAAVHRLQGS
ncbi:SHOCT domain-containing protein [Mycolicibacterium sphagni]|uniref:SHOCT domain-containing protein n=1 Tax=Mycolicibacterium sphagni TaxID=1786 RepID=A0A255DTS2_9MYCO|nr:SHOCT domain-containing protein [Mycolicibacterium sphagni]MCV7179820.1 SHOCT domain-containing protein [Mycolicibacterium sphagni]OYN80655.1 hypothetical protein CG716_07265 [Mycolicibacterium sphagni]